MDQKITRRVVLGTVIGGLAAGPFVMRALRRDMEGISGDEKMSPTTNAAVDVFYGT